MGVRRALLAWLPRVAMLWAAWIPLLGTAGRLAAQEALRGPPDGTVNVAVGLHLIDIFDINEDEKTFEFEGTLTLHWKDPRLSFDPSAVGSEEKVYQGDYQFAEVFNGWWPPLVLRNGSGRYERQGVVIRIQPDGSVTYVEVMQAAAELTLDLRQIPFDQQQFEIAFSVLGFGADRVRLMPDTAASRVGETTLLQWQLGNVETAVFTDDAVYAGHRSNPAAAIVFTYPAKRSPLYLLRIVVFPIMILVALSWSVFWMDSESLGSRMDITFIAILTIVAFQIVVSDKIPRIPYFTIMSSFMYLSYLALAASVLVNLRVAALDKRAEVAAGDRLDRTCRWLFPVGYLACLGLTVGYYLLMY